MGRARPGLVLAIGRAQLSAQQHPYRGQDAGAHRLVPGAGLIDQLEDAIRLVGGVERVGHQHAVAVVVDELPVAEQGVGGAEDQRLVDLAQRSRRRRVAGQYHFAVRVLLVVVPGVVGGRAAGGLVGEEERSEASEVGALGLVDRLVGQETLGPVEDAGMIGRDHVGQARHRVDRQLAHHHAHHRPHSLDLAERSRCHTGIDQVTAGGEHERLGLGVERRLGFGIGGGEIDAVEAQLLGGDIGR